MENPNIKGHATPESLRAYALYRKNDEMKDIKKVGAEMESGKIESDNESENYREPLGISIEKVIKIQLSTGGDGDGFKFTADGSGITGGVYYWEDWGCYEEVELSQAELDLVADYYMIDEWL